VIRWLQTILSPAPDAHDKFDILADNTLPRGDEGTGYYGADLCERLGLPHTLHLYIHCGATYTDDGWGAMTFGPRHPGTPPAWYFWSAFRTREEAVEALARSLRMMDEELAREDPDLDAVRTLGAAVSAASQED